ncbi:hypothetical protein N7504_009026 [Penicillium tannophilum]|nr:hypothetical protein N7504_009026 [Penicillium tannophilum]
MEYDDECDDRDYCIPEPEGSAGKGDYTWCTPSMDTIYRENCFMKTTEEALEDQSHHIPLGGLQAASDFRNVLPKTHQRLDGLELELDNECLEKRVFHRLISGTGAALLFSTHLCWDS